MLYRYETREHTVANMTTVGDPTSQTDHRDLKAGTSEVSVFHFLLFFSGYAFVFIIFRVC